MLAVSTPPAVTAAKAPAAAPVSPAWELAFDVPLAAEEGVAEIHWAGRGALRHGEVSRLQVQVWAMELGQLQAAFKDCSHWSIHGCASSSLFTASAVEVALPDVPVLAKPVAAHIGVGDRPASVQIQGLQAGAAIAVRIRPFLHLERRWGEPSATALVARPAQPGAVGLADMAAALGEGAAAVHPAELRICAVEPRPP